jgi:hypothetical protein
MQPGGVGAGKNSWLSLEYNAYCHSPWPMANVSTYSKMQRYEEHVLFVLYTCKNAFTVSQTVICVPLLICQPVTLIKNKKRII